MIQSTLTATEEVPKKIDADRVGVFLSVLCAIHCAVTPFLLILLPTFGKIWSHPASHWGMALFVIPIAVAMLTSGYRRHRKKWIIVTGCLGIVFVIIGAILPYVETKPASGVDSGESAPATVTSDQSGQDDDVFVYVKGETKEQTQAVQEDDVFVYVKGQEMPGDDDVFVYVKGEEMPGASTGCVDNCCPSLITDENGNVRLHIPPASIVTTLGGISLIVTHLGNICSCASCRPRRRKKAD